MSGTFKEANFTAEQWQAVTTINQNLALIAGAGSGKTHVLVNRFIYLLEQNPDWPLNALVAITFTKKAAAEMRDRVRHAIEDRYHADPQNTRWSDLLAQMDSARIDTIHGLCGDILRANAAYAGIDPDFTVLDENESAILLDDVIDSVLVEITQDSGDPCMALLTEYRPREVREILGNEAALNMAFPDESAEVILMRWRESYGRHIRAGCAQYLAAIAALDIPSADKLTPVFDAVTSFLEALRDDPAGQGMMHAFPPVNLQVGSVSNWGGKDELKAAKDVLRDIREWVKVIAFDEAHEAKAAAMAALWMTLIRRVGAAYRQAKSRNAQLDFNDLERIACDLLTRHPTVRERYQGAEFKQLLVDEFQDTNATQWQIVKGLADINAKGSLFVVGDPKQSIYGFRGADVSVFGDVRAEITQAGGADLPLSCSFRTHKPLLDGFNALFGQLLISDESSPAKAYQVTLGKAMTATRENAAFDAPYIELSLIPKTDDYNTVEDRRAWEADEIAERIAALVESGCAVYDKATKSHRPIQYGDIAILFRTLRDSHLYESALKARAIPYMTVSGMGYYGRQEVWDLLSVLQAVANPADDLSLAVALRSPLFSLSDEALLVLRADGGRLWDALAVPAAHLPPDQVGRVAFAADCLQAWRGMIERMTIPELLRDVLARTGYMATLTGLPDGVQRRANVEKLLAKAEASGGVTLGAFLHRLRELTDREAREGSAATLNTGNITLMTVHASKGLEFPVVVLADASRGGRGRTDRVGMDALHGLACQVAVAGEDDFYKPYCYRLIQAFEQAKDDAEALRLLYVAATRAGDLFIISGQANQTRNGWSASGWLDRVLDATELKDVLETGMDEPIDGLLTCRVRVSAARPSVESGAGTAGDWPSTPSVAPVMPPLNAPVTIRRTAQARQMAATHIADLGSTESVPAAQSHYYRGRFRRQVLYDAPDRVETVSVEGVGRIKPHQVGEIVHEALRHWHLPVNRDDAHLQRILAAYAWRMGIADTDLAQEAVKRARGLLMKFCESAIYHQISAAPTIYREMPFIYQREEFVIHGIIDVVYRTADGTWVIADYKTSLVRGGDYDDHARRYHLQLGVYAAALQAQLGAGIVPETRIHYIRHNQTVEVAPADWRAALAGSLASRIQKIIEEHDE